MLLVTTAIEDFCDRSGPRLFLGSWCVPWTERNARMQPGDVVMPSIWDDRTRFYDATRYADQCAERLLKGLGTYLDNVHAEGRGLRYWRIVLGTWVIQYVHSAYDRWLHLDAALTQYPGLRTILLHPDSYVTPRTGTQVYEWLANDAYNLQLYSQLLRARDHRCSEERRVCQLLRDVEATTASRTAPLRRVVGKGERAVVRRLSARVGLSGISLGWGKRWQLTVATRGELMPIPPMAEEPFAGPAPVFDGRRRGLAGLPAQDAFERTIVDALPVNLPTVYLEGHVMARDAARQAVKSVRVDAILTETDWYGAESMRHFAAEAAASGAKLVAMQHGGGYGTYRFSSVEQHERRAADLYLVWGWADAESLRNWPSLILADRRERKRRTTPSGILLVLTTQPRYLHWFNSQPAGTQMESYLSWQIRFLTALPSSIRNSVTVRPHAIDYGQGIWPRIATQFPQIRRDRLKLLRHAIGANSIVVIDHCATALLEAFVENVPTVLFWQPDRWELRSAAEPFFDALRRVGILHHEPEQAAQHVASLCPGAATWWQTAEIQEVRRVFVKRFALSDPRGVSAWSRGLADEIDSIPALPPYLGA